jgi:hypothetical protein
MGGNRDDGKEQTSVVKDDGGDMERQDTTVKQSQIQHTRCIGHRAPRTKHRAPSDKNRIEPTDRTHSNPHISYITPTHSRNLPNQLITASLSSGSI